MKKLLIDASLAYKNIMESKNQILDIKLKELDLEIKKYELETKKRENRFRRIVNNSLVIALIGGLLGIIGSIANSYYQHLNERNIEQQKLTSSLILSATETIDKYKSIENLKFLQRLNLIETENKILDSILSDSTQFYTIPSVYQKYLITILDSSKKPLPELDVFYNTIFVGRTSNIGQVEMHNFTSNKAPGEIEVRSNGVECGYVDVNTDNKYNIQLRVKLPMLKSY